MLLKNDRYLRALQCQDVDATPVWIMRQAGRYLPEYRKLRASVGDFLTLCKTPELACEATMQPIRRFDLDAAIIFSDILTIPDAMGLGLYFEQGEGPKFKKTISNIQDIKQLATPDPESELAYVINTIRLAKAELNGNIPLIGFSGSPWTLATYMIEGGSSKTFTKIKKMLYQDPISLHLLLDKLSESIALYLNAQIKAGVQSVMIFDTWGGVLSHRCYAQFSLHYMTKIIALLNRGEKKDRYVKEYVPVTLFTKGGGLWLNQIMQTPCDAIGVDWTVELSTIPKGKTAIQGNLDPSILYADKHTIENNVELILQEFGHHNGHIFNLGHGINPDTPPENLAILINAVHQKSKDLKLKNGR